VTQLTDAATQDDAEAPRRGGRRRVAVIVAVVVIVLGSAAAVLLIRNRPQTAPPAAASVATTPVVRTNLVQTEQEPGTLGYAGSIPVPARPSAGAVLTWLPQPGQVIQRGQQVYGVSNVPVPLFYGAVPFWRPLAVGMTDGPDVQELRENLRALGFGPGLLDDQHFSQGVADAVKSWQASLGVPQTGTVAPQDVLVEAGAVRVTGVSAVIGSAPSGTLMTLSGTDRVVTVNLPVAQQSLATQGAAVRIELPGSASTSGHISQIGSVATAPTPTNGAQPDPQQATIVVQIALDRPGDAGTLDDAPVNVDFSSQTRNGVLAVPIAALLALPSGGYAVEVVTGQPPAQHIAMVGVNLGLFAAGQVEISGPGIAEGTRVEVPSPS
jgi:peptidoglycan hydrolase-like protein with peptidoglycan-binding domain